MAEKVVSSRRHSDRSVASISLSAILLAMAVALAAVSKFIPFFHFANGGSISLSMVPLTLNALILGPVWGTVGGIAFGVIDMLFDGGWVFNWVSIVLDYIVAFGLAGVAGIFRKYYFRNKTCSLVAGLLSFGILRLFVHFLSGCTVMWDSEGLSYFQPTFDSKTMIYSISYNAGYMIPSLILSVILLLALAKPLFSFNGNSLMKKLDPYKEEAKPEEENKRNIVVLSSLSIVYLVTGIFSVIPPFVSWFVPYADDSRYQGRIVLVYLLLSVLIVLMVLTALWSLLIGLKKSKSGEDGKKESLFAYSLSGLNLLMTLFPIFSMVLFHSMLA